MSADNGIYILKTKAEDLSAIPFEYRVAHAQGIENIYWDHEEGGYRGDGRFTPEIAFEYFGNAPVFGCEADALALARNLESEATLLEYGICTLDHGDQEFETFSKAEIDAFEKRGDLLLEEHREKRQREIEKNLSRRTIQIPAHSFVEVFGRVEFPSPDWDGDKPETHKMFRGSFKGRVCVELLDEVEVIVDDEFAPVGRAERS